MTRAFPTAARALIRPTLLAAGAGAAALALTSCGGSSGNGFQSKSPTQILNASAQAVGSTSSAHVSGSVAQGGQQITLDITSKQGQGGTGSISLNGQKVGFTVIGPTAYLNAPAAFWQAYGGASAAATLAGRWVKVPTGSSLNSLSTFANLPNLLNQAITQHHGALKKGALATVNGQQVIPITSGTGTLFVAATGKPYPIEIKRTGSAAGSEQLNFDRYGQPVTLAAPPNPINAP